MALFLLCKTTAGPVRVSRTQLVLYCLILSLIIYFLRGRRAAVIVHAPQPVLQALEPDDDAEKTTDSGETPSQAPLETPWGAPLVWGDSSDSAGRRAEFAQQGVRTGLLTLVVGTYAKFVRRFLQSAETFFLPGQAVTYYILTDNPRVLEPPVKLGPQRQLTVVAISELPGWQRLAYRRMALIADIIGNPIGKEVEYLFCADVDQVFVETVGQEILGDLVATLHPELYAMPRSTFPYEIEEDSTARVADNEGDYYYTSELYGGLRSEVYRLTRACSSLILRDQANGVAARGLEESYLNRYLINHKPTCVLSPEYSWWDSALSTDVPVQRIVSLGRQCEALDKEKREELHC